MDRAAFRTKRKIFATLGADRRVNMMIQPEDRRTALLEAFPETFFSLGGWSRLGYLAVDLGRVDAGLLRELLEDAWRDALPVAKKAKTAKAGPPGKGEPARGTKRAPKAPKKDRATHVTDSFKTGRDGA